MIGLIEVLAIILFIFGAVSPRKRGWWMAAAVCAFIVLVNTP